MNFTKSLLRMLYFVCWGEGGGGEGVQQGFKSLIFKEMRPTLEGIFHLPSTGASTGIVITSREAGVLIRAAFTGTS